MNFFEDAVRFFSNMKKEASAKHILIKGAGATDKLNILKAELAGVEDLSAAFSELASKVKDYVVIRNRVFFIVVKYDSVAETRINVRHHKISVL